MNKLSTETLNKIKKLKDIINNSNNIVAFTGAGVSTESGLKDFRSSDGLYNIKNKYHYSAEYLLSTDCFNINPTLFYDFYKNTFNCLKAEPNITHKYLKTLEDQQKLKAIITQNIDGLHTKAGSKTVYEIHGTILKNHCPKCHKEYNADYIFNHKNIPLCSCGNIIKPDVVLYGDMLPEDALNNGIKAIINAETLIVLGTSLTVEPASSLVRLFKGKNLIILNKDKTQYDKYATLVINEKLSTIIKELKDN